jgi:glycosyltransferase involved in cell wall biosynthesis
MMKKKKILFLYAEIMGYTESILDELLINFKVDLTVIENDSLKVSSYEVKNKLGFRYKRKSDIKNLFEHCISINPDLVYVSGRMDPDYLKLAKYFKKNGKIVVSGFDSIWLGNFRQHIGSLLSFMFYKPYFTHAWVAGFKQYDYVKKMGFKNSNIIFNLYSANMAIFGSKQKIKENIGNTNILYVGRITKIKGVDLLIQAFADIVENSIYADWTLTIIGNDDKTINTAHLRHPQMIIKDFLGPQEIIKIANESAFFCLPSHHEPWGVVIHEFAAIGLPLLLSNKCGANDTFLITGFNGYSFKAGDMNDLKNKLQVLMNLSQNKLNEFGENSRVLAQRITPKISAFSLMSLTLNS